jgi:nicotinamide mononucleotide transporter
VIAVTWISNHFIEVFGAVTGILYVFLEIRQNLWLWPVGIATSATYIWVFFHGKLYADMSLQVYYLVVSILGWYWWIRGTGHRAQGIGQNSAKEVSATEEEMVDAKTTDANARLVVHRINLRSGIILLIFFVLLYFVILYVLSRFTDSPVPEFDSLITSLSVVATWMLARKIFEHWYLWIVVNALAAILFFRRGLYPTVILYFVYFIMSFAGFLEWRKSLTKK